ESLLLVGEETSRAWHAVEHHLLDQLGEDRRRPGQLERARWRANRAVMVACQRVLGEQLNEWLPENNAPATQQCRPLRHEATISEAVRGVVVAQKLVP